jgi:hypothetical protein
LGERVNGIHEVGGSIPPGSTKFRSEREFFPRQTGNEFPRRIRLREGLRAQFSAPSARLLDRAQGMR